jgi:hypothetical protein
MSMTSHGSAPALQFASKRDRWVSALLGCAAVSCVVAVAGALHAMRGSPGASLAVLLACLWPITLVIWMLGVTRYEIAGDALRVRCGPLRFAAPFAEIDAVHPKRGFSPELGWSLSLSLDRLVVRRRGRLALSISPEPRELFLAELAARCPQLVREGDRLVRRAAP